MFASFSSPFSIFSGRSSSNEKKPVNLPSVTVQDAEKSEDQRSRRLRSLLKLNHANHAIIYHNLTFHNHTPHILGSAYILGGTTEHLSEIYDAEAASLEPWTNSPAEVTKDDWRDYLGQREYQRGYIDFFEDELLKFNYDWKRLVDHYLYEGKEPLINSFASGLAHPLIHLGYAYELNNKLVGIEALGLITCFYDDLHKYLDDPSYTRPSKFTSSSILEIVQKVAEDPRLENLSDHQGSDNIETLLANHEDLVLEYWNAWDVNESNLQERLAEAQHAAVALVVGSKYGSPGSTGPARNYDFFLVHGLTSSHAVRILLPEIRGSFHLSVARQWFMFVLTAYIGQLRPKVDIAAITEFKAIEGEDNWKWVDHIALTSVHSTDAHFVKALRAMKVAEATWGEHDGYWLKAACKMAKQFNGWGGFDHRTAGYKAH